MAGKLSTLYHLTLEQAKAEGKWKKILIRPTIF